MRETLQLVTFILRRERLSLVLWVIGIVGIVVYMPFLYEGMYPTVTDRYAAMLMMANPAIVAIVGPSTGAYTLGALMTQEILLISVLAVGIMNVLLVNRHTRVDEELGRLELIRSFPVGSTTILQAVFAVVVVANVLIGGLVAVGFAVSGVEGLTVAGSVLFGAILTVSGLLFAAVTAVCAQAFSTAKGASGAAFMVLLVMYMVRAVGDIAGNFLSYVSPLGLVLQTRTFVDDVWWPLAVVLVQVVVLSALAVYLISQRDLGMGLIPAKAGPRGAAPSLLSVDGLAWRLSRGSLLIWTAGTFLVGLAYGAVIGEVETYIGENEMLQMLLASVGSGDATGPDQFIPFLIMFLVIVLMIPIVGPILRLAGEEKRNLTEHLLSRVVTRGGLLRSYFLISMLASMVLLAAGGFGFWLSGSMMLDDPIALTTMMGAMLVYLPATWLLIGLAVLLVGWLPKFAGFSMLMIGFMFFIGFFGAMLALPEVVMNLSPLSHVPAMPVDDFSAVSFSVMTSLAVALMAAGFVGYSRRDMQG
ncbi:MAG: hypothetical protein FWE07_02370 [Turicibacter sp.]|nr:hypothetical protein [Turicibacter sp.]